MYNFIKKGKTYFQGNLEFEGDYFFYDKWNGKGYDKDGNVIYELKYGTGKIKKYSATHLQFEGEYIDGIINGHVKDYFENGKLEFEGEYLNGKRNGKGKEYGYFDGKLKFEGEYLNGLKMVS